MKQQPIPWTLIYHDAPKGFNSLHGKVRAFLSPNEKTIELQVNENGINSHFGHAWLAWIIRVEYNKKGWQVKKDSYANSAQKVYQELYNVAEEIAEEMSTKEIEYHITTFAIQKKDRYFMDCLFNELGISIENEKE